MHHDIKPGRGKKREADRVSQSKVTVQRKAGKDGAESVKPLSQLSTQRSIFQLWVIINPVDKHLEE